jgi:hypothetical protein
MSRVQVRQNWGKNRGGTMGIKDIFGRNMNINDDIRERYKNLQKGFIFKGKDYKCLFMLSLALGYKSGENTPVKDPKGHLNVNSFDDNDLWTIVAIAVEDTGDLQIMKNGLEMKKIATEYAHTGLGILEDLTAENGSGETLELVIEKMARESLDTYLSN